MNPAKAIGHSDMPFGRYSHLVPSNTALEIGHSHTMGRGYLGVSTFS